MAKRKYYICVYKDAEPEDYISEILDSEEFQYYRAPEGVPARGDKVIFYVSDGREMYFGYAAIVIKGEHKSERRRIGNNIGPLAIDFNDVIAFKRNRPLKEIWDMPLPLIKKRNDGEKGWKGRIFHGKAFVLINKTDYNLLKTR